MRLIKSCIRILVARSGIPDAVCTRMLTLAVADAVPLGPTQGCFAALVYGSGRSGKQRDHGFLRGARFSLLHCGRGRRRKSFLFTSQSESGGWLHPVDPVFRRVGTRETGFSPRTDGHLKMASRSEERPAGQEGRIA